MTRSRPLCVESLEDRSVPAPFGNPWPDGMHLTLSFAPDGTVIDGNSSNLSEVLASLGTTAARMEILRAFQAWAAVTNVNIGLVGDGGQDFGVGAAIQSDSRFGDIRIGAAGLPGDVLAVTAPFNLFSSYSGNVVLNSNATFSLGGSDYTRDLFTVFLQEAGHTLSVGNSHDMNSAMYEYYLGARTGLSSSDISAVQALYGVRQADAYEGTAGNDTRRNARALGGSVEADITTTDDVDFFKFTTPLLFTNTTVRLKAAGLSLLTAKLVVFDAQGNVVARTSTKNPTKNDLTLNLTGLKGNSTYYVKVQSARNDAFGVGSYQLSINSTGLLGTVTGAVNLISTELGVNDVLSNATNLVQNVVSSATQYDYVARASLAAAGDLDFYRIHAPTVAVGETLNMVALAWGLDGSQIDPRLEVYDSAGNLVSTEVLTNNDGAFVLQLRNARPDADYFLRVCSDSNRIGNYQIAVDFNTTPIEFSLSSSGTLSDSYRQRTATLNVHLSQQMHFVLSAGPAKTDAKLMLIIRNSAGQIVHQMSVVAGESRSADVFLADGTYTVTVAILSLSGDPLPSLGYQLNAIGITDPVGAQKSDTTSAPEGGTSPNTGSPPPDDGSSSTWSSTDSSDGSAWY